jgi:peptidyl-prolyl cis-trans isomerase C
MAKRLLKANRNAQKWATVTWTLCGLALSGAVHAATTPDAATPSAPRQEPSAPLVNPAGILATMADQLDRKPDFVVLKLENLPITQHDVAGVIRAMPLGMASLNFEEVYRRALDVMVRQKAMVLRARLEKIDQDPDVKHQSDLAVEHVLVDAWLKRRADAAVTDKALHDLYDSQVAGKPGPDQVKARVILVATEAEAEALIQKLRDGADFAELARQVSKDPSAQAGGDLGYRIRESVTPEVGAAMFSLGPGQTTTYPVASIGGYFVIRVEARSSHGTLTFDEARPMLEKELRAHAVSEAIGSLLSNVKFVPPSKPGEQAVPVKQ